MSGMDADRLALLAGLAVGGLHRVFDVRLCAAGPWVESLCIGVTDGWLQTGYQDWDFMNGYVSGEHHDDRVPDT